MNSLLTKYVIASSAYSFLRKPLVLQNHQLEIRTSPYDQKKYRNLMVSEIIPLTILSGIAGQFIAPIHLCDDIRNFEISVRGLQNEMYTPQDFQHSSFPSLCLV